MTPKAEMCTRFERGLNEDIRAMVRMLEIMELVALSQRAQRIESI